MDTSIEATLQTAVQALGNREPELAVTTIQDLLRKDPPIEGQSEMFARGLLAPALASLGRIVEARVEAVRAYEIADQLGDKESAQHYDALVRQLDVVGMSDEAVDQAFDRAAAALDVGDSPTAEAELHTILVAALAHVRADVEASARGMLAQALILRGATAEAREQCQKALELAQAVGDTAAAQHFTGLLSQLATPDGAEQYRREAEVARRAEEVARQAGAIMEAGDFDGALALLESTVGEAEAAGVRHSEATLRGMMAQAHLMSGRRKDAEREAKAALVIAQAMGATEAAESFRQIIQLAIGFTAPISEA
ncbi:MAG: hypothetical protein U1F43_31190 [Myxococcota bacterium]